MAKHEGGIFSRGSGKTAAIVFSQARTRKGKRQTSRQLITPTNPQTTSQTQNRQVFTNVVRAIANLDLDYRNVVFNRAVSKLPGQQSLMTIIRNRTTYDLGHFQIAGTPPDIPRNGLHFPNTMTFELHSADDKVHVTWSTELGTNGADTDQVNIFTLSTYSDDTTGAARLYQFTQANRSAGAVSFLPVGASVWLDENGAWAIAWLSGQNGTTSPPFSLIRFSGSIPVV